MNKNFIISLLWVVAGNCIYALTVTLFLLPVGLVTGGTTGIAMTINHFTGMEITTFVYIFNIAMLIFGFLILGKKFALTTIASTFLYPVALDLFTGIAGDFVLTENLILCTVFSGLGIGIAVGVVVKAGASTGGMDIPPLVLRKIFRLPVAVTMYVFDVCILLSQAAFRPVENILFGIILVMIYTIVIDKVLINGTSRTEIKVISSKSDEIREAILNELDRGVTMLDGEGGRFKEEKQIVLSIISNWELAKAEKLIHEIDPHSFIIINRVKEVSGRGFSLEKHHQ